jgi:hypothetical protein
MARTAWALMRKGEDYRDPVMATASVKLAGVSPRM